MASPTAQLAALDATDDVAGWLNGLVPAERGAAEHEQDGAPSSGLGTRTSAASAQERQVQRQLVAIGDLLVDAQTQTDAAMRRLRTAVPHIKYDVRVFQDTAARLAAHAAPLALARPPDTQGDVLDRLHRLALLQERVSASRDILRDAEAWSSLEGDVDAYLAEGKPADAALRLSEATGSLGVFAQTSAYAAREALVAELKRRLVSSLRPALERAVAASDVSSAADMLHTLSLVSEQAAFERAWIDARVAPLAGEWAHSASDPVSALTRLYSAIQTKVEEERVYSDTLFPQETPAHLAQFVTIALDSLQPSVSHRLAQVAEDERALPRLLACWHATEEAVRAVGATISRTQPQDTPTGEWETVLLTPFLPYQSRYALMSRLYLDATWEAPSGADPAALQRAGESALALASDASRDNIAFTKGYATSSLLEAADAFLGECFSALEARLKRAYLFVVVDPSSSDGLVRVAARTLAVSRTLFSRLLALEGEVASSTRAAQEFFLGQNGDSTELAGETTAALLAQLEATGLDTPALHEALSTLRQIRTLGPSKHLYRLRADVPLPPPPLLLRARGGILHLVQSAQMILLKAVQEPLATPLLVYASLPVWTSVEQRPSDGVAIPTFSLSPTETVAGLGEALLDLPRALEVYTQDAALGFGIHALPLLDLLADAATDAADGVGAGATTHARSVERHDRRTSLLPTDTDEPAAELSAGEVLSLYLLSILRSFLARLTGEILPGLPRLSAYGARQLSTDLEFLESILAVLNYVEPAQSLSAWRRLVALDTDTGRKLAADPAQLEPEVRDTLLPLRASPAFQQVARLRGFSRTLA